MFGIALDKQAIENMLHDFYSLTKIRIAFYSHDLKESIAVKKELCRFCGILRTDPEAYKKCMDCDRIAFQSAKSSGKLHLYECHAGLTEGIAPIIWENKLLGFLMMGQTLRAEPVEELWKNTFKKCREYRIDFQELKQAFFELNHLEWNRMSAAARIMDLNAKYIYLSNMAIVHELPVIEQFKEYVAANLGGRLTISETGKYLKISKSHLSHMMKTQLNTDFTRYVRQRRIEKAKLLLGQTQTKIIDIARQVGFPDLNYFSRLFKKETGYSPRAYRNSCKEKAELC